MTVKVLILEGNPVARGFLGRVVRESFSDAISITEAGDTQGARRQIAQAGPDPFRLVLIDLELPDGQALELLAELAGQPALCLVTTLYADDEHLFPALQRGADGYLFKEDRFELLVEALQRTVRGQPPLSPAIARRLLSHFRAGAFAAGPSRPPAWPNEPPQLTPRENEVLTFLSKGFTIKEIAGLLRLDWSSVNDQILAIYRKLKPG
ncbi:response regulator [Azohydromonas caseinilytica]|uniref:Response regulator transcription factor n=1 Tax=Azohydromonas caseinilytica TaxID=2728836 RepID=A0A848F890_9BURK|nr:response regulator transcription factor [Azohydromonas caseinilytica]NML15418.1 response regulator transcription factor [Azohydromonas caseinilytica]